MRPRAGPLLQRSGALRSASSCRSFAFSSSYGVHCASKQREPGYLSRTLADVLPGARDARAPPPCPRRDRPPARRSRARYGRVAGVAGITSQRLAPGARARSTSWCAARAPDPAHGGRQRVRARTRGAAALGAVALLGAAGPRAAQSRRLAAGTAAPTVALPAPQSALVAFRRRARHPHGGGGQLHVTLPRSQKGRSLPRGVP
jgi:hypothetical protein